MLLDGPFVDAHHSVEEFECVGLLALEGVAANDRAEAAAITNAAHLVEERLIGGGCAAGENDDAATIEGALHNMTHALRQGRDGNLILLVDFLRFGQLYFCAWQLHLY